MKRTMMMLVLLLVAGPVLAGPYFRIDPLSEIRTGGFFKLGASADHVNWGMTTRVIYHSSADGHLLIKGVDWDLLDVGGYYKADTKKGALVFGPSINLEEPVKKVLLRGIQFLPKGKDLDHYTMLRRVLQPGGDDKSYLALGPQFGLEPASQWSKWRGHFILAVTCNKRF